MEKILCLTLISLTFINLSFNADALKNSPYLKDEAFSRLNIRKIQYLKQLNCGPHIKLLSDTGDLWHYIDQRNTGQEFDQILFYNKELFKDLGREDLKLYSKLSYREILKTGKWNAIIKSPHIVSKVQLKTSNEYQNQFHYFFNNPHIFTQHGFHYILKIGDNIEIFLTSELMKKCRPKNFLFSQQHIGKNSSISIIKPRS